MIYRKLDDNLDYSFGRRPGDSFLMDSEAVTQAIVTRLNLLLEEWWEDRDNGLPLFQEILGRYNSTEDIDLVLTERIVDTRGVRSVRDVQGTRDTRRKYTYTATVETVYGDQVPLRFGFDGIRFVIL